MSGVQNGVLLRTANACLTQLRFRRRSIDTTLTGRVYELVKSGAIDELTLQRMSAAVHQKLHAKSTKLITYMPKAGEFGESSRRVGLVGIKLGMMPQWEAKTGKRVLCTLIYIPDNQVVQVLDPETWYRDTIVGKRKAYGRYGSHYRLTVGAQNIDPVLLDPKWRAYFNRHGIPAKQHIGSFLVSSDAVLPEGFRLDVRHFSVGQFVNVSGRTIDWGFQGGMHRWGMRGLPDRRTTKAHRRIGSIGSCGDARVWPGKRMPGHMGYEWRQVSGLEVVRINPLESVIYVKGSVPGDVEERVLINDCLHEYKRVKNPPFPTYLETIHEENESKDPTQILNAANSTSADIYHEKLFRFDSPSIVFTAADEKQSASRDKMRAKIAKVKNSLYDLLLKRFFNMGLSSRELKQIKMALSSVPDFIKPKQSLEQYMTSVDMAIDIMNFIEDETGLFEKKVLDLGCGTGMLAMAANAFGAKYVLGVDIDPDVLEVAQKNVNEDDEGVEFEKHNVITMDLSEKSFDVIITNPPFGTKDNAHIDSGFILTAFRHLAPTGRIYSLHKSSCSEGIIKKFTKKFSIVKATPAATLNWLLKSTYKHHKQKAVDIQVTLIEWIIEESASSDEHEALMKFAKDFASHMDDANHLFK